MAFKNKHSLYTLLYRDFIPINNDFINTPCVTLVWTDYIAMLAFIYQKRVKHY